MFKGTVTSVMAALVLTMTAPLLHARDSHDDATFERDRQAILDMAGQYQVGFRFWETVPIKQGYDTAEPYRSGATELVKVVEDTGQRIVLQRLLLVGEEGDRGVVKHWRQVWQYEPDVIFEFKGNRTWQPRKLSDQQAEGQWAETVYQVDDSPRYAGLGEWSHQANLSAWQSSETWRPLPRRERKQRDDYDVLVTRNRYTQTPTGWAHEQDSYKLVLKDGQPEQVLTREVGLNTYDRTQSVDFSPVRDYWQRTAPFWSQVRDAWSQIYARGETIRLKYKVDDKKLWHHVFDRAEDIESAESYDKQSGQRFIDRTLSKFLIEPTPSRTN
jgi:hypothetical protein